jgi:very-short-patch-repair endonuclease
MRSMGRGRMRAPVLTFKRARTLRREMTLPEVVLWGALRGGRLNGMRFRRQHPIGPYILDFYCPSTRLAVEIDGFAHDNPAQVEHDERRDAWLAARGVKIVRVAAADVLKDHKLEGVLLAIEQAAAPPPSAVPLPRCAGEEPIATSARRNDEAGITIRRRTASISS